MKRKRMSRRQAGARPAPEPAPQPAVEGEDRGEVVELAEQVAAHPEGGPELSAGDVDADWMRGARTAPRRRSRDTHWLEVAGSHLSLIVGGEASQHVWPAMSQWLAVRS